jgi:hypothetical protein
LKFFAQFSRIIHHAFSRQDSKLQSFRYRQRATINYHLSVKNFYSDSMKSLVSALSFIFLFGCAATGRVLSPAADNYLATKFKTIDKAGYIILLPNKSPDALVNRGEGMVLNQLQRQLKQAGYKVGILDSSSYESIWAQEVAYVGGIFDQATGQLNKEAYAQVITGLVSRVCAEAKCTHIIKPHIASRSVSFDGSQVEWDGQIRDIPTSYAGGRTTRFRGNGSAFSVELTGLDAQGNLLFKQYGGASLIHEANVADVKLSLRTELFANDLEIADGVRIALKPLLAP